MEDPLAGFSVHCVATRKVRPKPKSRFVPMAADGCEWFRTCERCRFAECEANEAPTMSFAGRRSRAMRARVVAGALSDGAEPEEMELFFGLDEGEAIGMAATRLRPMWFERRPETRAEAVAARLNGEREWEVADRLHVSARTVRKWCEGVDGIDRGRNAGKARKSIMAAKARRDG